MTKWNWRTLLLFEATVCVVSLLFSIAGTTAPQVVVTIPAGGLSVRLSTVLFLLGSFLPGLIILILSKECLSAIRLRATIGIYNTAALIGFGLPFSSYLGARYAYPLWNASTGPTLGRVFLINLFLWPLWEEIIWRGYFYPKVNSMLRTGPAIIIAAVGCAIWQVGYLYYLHHSGTRPAILALVIIQFLLMGIILCSFFTLSRHALGPCILLHTAFNASSMAYFGSYNRVNDIGSYVSETVFTLIVAILVFSMAVRRAGNSFWQAEKPSRSRSQPSTV